MLKFDENYCHVNAHIDLSALRHNLSQVRLKSEARPVLAMVKANAYGHGLLPIAKALADAEALGVAACEEGVALRNGGISQPIFIMSRFDRDEYVQICSRFGFVVVVYQPYQVEILERCACSQPVGVWLKLDTGMNRLGLSYEQFVDAYQRLQKLSWIQKPIGVMTHLACADDPEHPLTSQQINSFQELTRNFPGPKSIANSAALLTRQDALADWVRPGIMLYGGAPLINKTGRQCGLKPVMTLTSRIIAIKSLKKGEFVGYGASWQSIKDITLAALAVGYGDGYPRHASFGAPVLVNGVICHLVGRISMDTITIDLNPEAEAKVGDSVTLWGKGLPAEHVARFASTINYELFCQVASRAKFHYHE